MSTVFENFSKFSVPGSDCSDGEDIAEVLKIGDSGNCVALLICSHDGNDVSQSLLRFLQDEFNTDKIKKSWGDNKIQNYLKNLFTQFETDYLNGLKNTVERRKFLQESIEKSDDFLSHEEDYKKFQQIEKELRSGCTFCGIFFLNNEFYIVNIGDNQLLILLEDKGFLSYTDQHNFYNAKETKRIVQQCCLKASALTSLYGKSYSRYHSRCLGHYDMKKEYNKRDSFVSSINPPIIMDPQIKSGLQWNQDWRNILLISNGLYYTVMDLIYDQDKISGELANEFFLLKDKNDNNLQQITKAIVQTYNTKHKEAFLQDNSENYQFEKLTLMAVELNNQSVESTTSTLGSLSKSLNSSIPNELKSYVSFDSWKKVETTLTDQQLNELNEVLSLKIDDTEPIIEEDEVNNFSRSTTIVD